MDTQFDVFLSHSSVDKPWVTQLKDDLLRRHISVWLDQDEIRPGDHFVKALEQALDNCQTVVLVVSPEAIASGWVEEEYSLAVALAKRKESPVRIIPVILREAELPGFLLTRNWVDFRDEGQYEQSLDKLVWGITGHKPDSAPQIDPALLHDHYFISYAPTDGDQFARDLHTALSEAGVPVWLDSMDAQEQGRDWDEQIVEALQTCAGLLFIVTADSVQPEADCTVEWTRAIKYKKPIVLIRREAEPELPLRLAKRQTIDFTAGDGEPFETSLTGLQQHLQWLTTPASQLQQLKERLTDAQRDLRRPRDPLQRGRIKDDITKLKQEIERQEKIVADPEAARERTKATIASGLERERQPEKPVKVLARRKFINPPPGVTPSYFQDRFRETELIGDFLKDEAQRIMTIVGRGGIGKTAIVARLLKSLESGQLPDGHGPLRVEGIVYLSAVGSRKINFPNLYADLSKLLPPEAAEKLETLYKNPQVSTRAKMEALLAEFSGDAPPDPPKGGDSDKVPPTAPSDKVPLRGGDLGGAPPPVILLLDNFEDVVDDESRAIGDAELDEALKAILTLPPHVVKVIITTRLAPQALPQVQPQYQLTLELDKGLESPFAENILREMDVDGKLGLKAAPEALLTEAKTRTRGYPRALEALFAILSADRDTGLDELLARADSLLPENVVEVLVGEAFNRLDSTTQRVMQGLAIYGRPVSPTALDYLLQPYLPGADSAPVLGRLVNMQFVRKEGGSYYLHPVDRAYALARIPRGEKADQQGFEALFDEVSVPFSQFALYHRGADYFSQTRRPRENWKSIEDLAPQLAEFDLRYAGQDYDTAADVLTDIDSGYLLLWGHYRLMLELHEQLQGKLNDPRLKRISVGNLGTAYRRVGQIEKAIPCYEEALSMAREQSNRQAEGVWLNNLGNGYANLGQIERAIEYYEQALTIAREIRDRRGEASRLGNMGFRYAELGQTERAIEYYEQALIIHREIGNQRSESTVLDNTGHVLVNQNEFDRAIQTYHQAIQIADEISFVQTQNYARWGLALAYLYTNDLPAARTTAEAARQYDHPDNNHNVLAVLGVIALRQGDEAAAQEAFAAAIAHTDELLGFTAQNFNALDAKGLALCGLALVPPGPPKGGGM